MEPFYTFRLGEKQQTDRENLAEYLEIFRRNPGCCDEVWYSTYYGYPPLERHRELAAMCREHAETIRKLGITVSLQISNTIGHGEYQKVKDFSGFVWDDMAGPDGTRAVYCSCPRDQRFLDYLSRTVRYYSEMQPGYVWIDDDLRMQHHKPVDFGCFCDRCLTAFNKLHKTNYSREELVAAINQPGSYETRKHWSQFNQDSLTIVASTICNGVMEVSPDSIVGVQQGSFASRSYSGGDFRNLYRKIRDRTGKPPACRPGGGVYNDHAPREMLRKGLNLCMQTLRLPKEVITSKAEVENIPHTVTGKSVGGTLVESALYLAFGCTSLSYSAFMTSNERPSFHEPLMAGLKKWRPFLEWYAGLNRGTKNAGAGIVFSRTPYKLDMKNMPPFAWASFNGKELFDLTTYGLPLTWSDADPDVFLLHNQAVDALSDDELKELFGKGVITDAQTVNKLNIRGLGDILNLETEAFEVLKGIDFLTDHPVNGPYAGQTWYNFYTLRNPFPPLKIRTEKNPSSEIIGHYVLRNREDAFQGISAVLTETASGGRAAVLGYNPWSYLINSGKRHQILKAADWLSKGSMPVYLETPSQVAVIPRTDGEGQLVSVMLLNVSIDSSPELKLHLRNCRNSTFRWQVPEKQGCSLKAAGSGEYDYSVTVGPLKPWSLGVVET